MKEILKKAFKAGKQHTAAIWNGSNTIEFKDWYNSDEVQAQLKYMKTLREELIDVLNFRDTIFYQENDFTENEEIVDLYLKSINSNAQDESLNVSDNESKEKICPTCRGKGHILEFKVDIDLGNHYHARLCDNCKGEGHI